MERNISQCPCPKQRIKKDPKGIVSFFSSLCIALIPKCPICILTYTSAITICSTQGHTITPSPHHPIGAKGVGESPTVGAPPAIANAICDALLPFGITNIDIPITPYKVWKALKEKGAI